MSFKSFLLYISFLCSIFLGSVASHAQSINADSARRAREELAEINRLRQEAYCDSVATVREKALAEQQRRSDSARYAREKYTDSVKFVRKMRSDSLAAVRKFKESKYYKDSVARARKHKTDSIAAVRKVYYDSIKTARKRITDSTNLVRNRSLDSIRSIQKRRSDSLARIRKYRESKRFSDSVAVVKKLRADSVKLVRKHKSDSMLAIRKAKTDSFAKVRKAHSDSLAKIRKGKTDSLAASKKVKTDSLAKAKEKRLKNQKAKEADKEKKQQLAFELKIKKKHQAYSNEKMLKKGWGFPRNFVQNNFTRYNYFYNADRKMDEAMLNMQRVRKDNYDSLLALFPFDPDRDSAMISADMDSIIRKVSVGIQIHDPRTKWGDDLYLLLGQAYFYKGNYPDAASSFRYILSLKDKKKIGSTSKKTTTTKGLSIAQPDKKGLLSFMQHRSVHNEAILWLARTFTQMRQEGNAESVLDLVETDPNFPQSLKGRLALEKAFIALHEKDQKAAIDHLTIVAADDNIPDVIRMRAAFVNGQLQMNRNDHKAAMASFTQVIDLYPKIEMDFYARKNLAYSTMLAGGDQKEAIAALKKVLNDGKYVAYYEQVYYVLGRLAANNGNNADAISYLNQGISSPKSTAKQKAISFATLGGIYYKQGDYTSAKSAYDSATRLASAAPNDSLVLVAMKRSAGLLSVTGPLNVIHMQDSLLALSALSEKEQRAEVRRYIRRLEQQKADSAFKAENAAFANAQNTQSNAAGMGGNTNSYANWYFANPSLMQQGMNEFKRKWGSRTATDNWRRMSAASGSNLAQNNSNAPEEEENPDLDGRGLPTEESLLAYIPTTAEMKKEAAGKTKRAYMDLATAYVKDLEDYPPAVRTLDTFDKRHPAHEYKAEELYLRYLMATRQSRFADAQGYANQLLQQYQDTKWAGLVKPSESSMVADTGQFGAEAAFYDETYDLLMQRQYPTVLARVRQAYRQYGDTRYRKRFTIVEGAALAGTAEYKYADSLLMRFVTEYPTDSLRPWADALLRYIKDNKPAPVLDTAGKAAGTNATGQPVVTAAGEVVSAPPGQQPATRLPVDPASPVVPVPGSNTQPAPSVLYTYNIAEPHFVLFVFGIMEARSMGVKAALTDFNTFKFSDQHLTTDIAALRPDKGIVVIKTFENLQSARTYFNAVKAEPKISKEYKPDEYQWILISSTNFDKLQKQRDIDTYIKFYNARYK